jgi:hypothetical protein
MAGADPDPCSHEQGYAAWVQVRMAVLLAQDVYHSLTLVATTPLAGARSHE